MIDINKKYRTRDGRAARIYATDGDAPEIIHGAVRYGNAWEIYSWREDGRFLPDEESEDDLIEVKPRIKMERWMNIYTSEMSSAFPNKEIANLYAGPTRVACVKVEIDCEEGEGL